MSITPTSAACLISEKACELIVADLDGDGTPEVVATANGSRDRSIVFMRDPGGVWREVGYLNWQRSLETRDWPDTRPPEVVLIEAIPPVLDDLRIGDQRLSFQPSPDSSQWSWIATRPPQPREPAPPAPPSPLPH